MNKPAQEKGINESQLFFFYPFVPSDTLVLNVGIP